MKTTAAARYAVRALAHLATRDDSAIVTSHDAARACAIPEKYLLKVFRLLVTAGVLRSLKGPNGGYRLARPAKAITVLEIVEAVEGPFRGLVPEVATAGDQLNQRLAAVCDQAADTTRKQLQKVRLADLAGAD
jgi:Rrf2 family protein